MRKQRAFQPTADQLETREALSSIGIRAHIARAPVNRTIQFNTPFANTLHLGFTTGTSLSASRTVTQPATTPVRVISPGTGSGMGTMSGMGMGMGMGTMSGMGMRTMSGMGTMFGMG